MQPTQAENTLNDGRFWENYLVRYLFPSIIGAAMVWALIWQIPNSYHIPPIFREEKSTEPTFLVIIGLLGFLFCYTASCFVLVVHCCRWINNPSNIKTSCIRFAVMAIIAIAFTEISFLLADKSHNLTSNDYALICMGVFSASWPWTYIIHTLTKQQINLAYIFYTKLALKRSNSSSQAREFIESYRHLREHGNAFFIVFAEIGLFIYLSAALKLIFPANNATSPSQQLLLIAFTLILWVFPGVSAWFLGTRLELQMVNEN